MIALLIAALLWSGQATNPQVVWQDPQHVFVLWRQEVDGERCITRRTPSGDVFDYGCRWVWGQLGVDVGLTIPQGDPHPSAYPQPGDIIQVGTQQAVVPARPHWQWLPLVVRQ